jgi:hypothetical protein
LQFILEVPVCFGKGLTFGPVNFRLRLVGGGGAVASLDDAAEHVALGLELPDLCGFGTCDMALVVAGTEGDARGYDAGADDLEKAEAEH